MRRCLYCWAPIAGEPKWKMEKVWRTPDEILQSDDLWDRDHARRVAVQQIELAMPEAIRVRIRVDASPTYCSAAHQWADTRSPDAPVNDRLIQAVNTGTVDPGEPQGEQEAMF